jgi:DNA-binding LacI/PurR family transcriptional regulator
MNQKELADALSLSEGTVSLALSGSPLVSDATRRRVLSLARRQGFRPNLAARSIRTGKTMSVGLILPSIAHPFNAALVDALQTLLLQAGYVGVYCPDNAPDDHQRALDALLSRRVDGIIAVATGARMVRALQQQEVPVVFYCADQDGLDEVTLDAEKSGWLAATHLTTHGHRRIAFIGPTDVDGVAPARYRGFRDALRSYGVELRGEFVKPLTPGFGQASARQGREAMQALLSLYERPTAVFTHNDQLALGAMRAAFEAELSVPADLSVVGHDDAYEGQYSPVALTSVALPIARIAQELAGLMLGKIAQRGNAARKSARIVLEPSLVVRESTGPAPKPETKGGDV